MVVVVVTPHVVVVAVTVQCSGGCGGGDHGVPNSPMKDFARLQGLEVQPNIKTRGQFRHLVVKLWEAP